VQHGKDLVSVDEVAPLVSGRREEGICFGWSESQRRRFDDTSYLQRFTPRQTPGTTSTRNVALGARMVSDGRMTAPGLEALGM